MTQLLAGMTMSLDGFVEGPPGQTVSMSVDEDADLASAQLAEAIEHTGAVLMGRRTFDMAEDPDLYADSYEFQVPIFVVDPPAPVTAAEGERRADVHLRDRRRGVGGGPGAGGRG